MDNLADFIVSESDIKILQRLEGFLPEKIFDVHAHLYNAEYLPVTAAPGTCFAQGAAAGGGTADRKVYERFQLPLYPKVKKVRLNVVSAPDPSMEDRMNGNRARCNEFLIRHLEQNPGDVGEAFVLPDDTDADVKGLLKHPNIRGFKCYHRVAAKKPTWQAGIGEYLPESAWRAAEDSGFCITLHLVKDAALSDPENIKTIREKARKYKNAKLILAHAARGFAAWTALDGVKRAAELTNVYFDVSAVCEPTAIYAVIKAAGAKRVLWGSDFPVSMFRGKCVSLADGFLWLYGKQLKELGVTSASLVGVESLNAFAQACGMLDLSRAAIKDMFYNNAMKMFGLSEREENTV